MVHNLSSDINTYNRNVEALKRWDRKVLGRIFGPVGVEGKWRLRSGRELADLFRRLDIVEEIS